MAVTQSDPVMTLYIADRQINEFMKTFDLRPDYKWFIKTVTVRFKPTKKLNDKFFLNLIEKSKAEKEKWVPAIQFQDKIYCDPSVKELSDGNKCFFVG